MSVKRKNKATRGNKRVRDVIDVRTPAGAMPPTPEQALHADYEDMPVTDRTADGRMIKLGRAFQRVPRYQSISGLTRAQIAALTAYRAAFDNSEMSETKCALDIREGGGGGGVEAALSRLEKIAFASHAVKRMEARVRPALLPTLRAVALHDKDFKALAIDRYGSREISRLNDSKRNPRMVTSIEPRSNRHREQIRLEFMDAAEQLVASVEAAKSKPGPAEEKAVTPVETVSVDPAFLDKRGLMRQWDQIGAIILARFMGEPEPIFPDEQAA